MHNGIVIKTFNLELGPDRTETAFRCYKLNTPKEGKRSRKKKKEGNPLSSEQKKVLEAHLQFLSEVVQSAPPGDISDSQTEKVQRASDISNMRLQLQDMRVPNLHFLNTLGITSNDVLVNLAVVSNLALLMHTFGTLWSAHTPIFFPLFPPQ